MRHLPPTAAPLTLSDLMQGLRALRARQEASWRFRDALARYLGTGHCYVASSGRTALYLLLCTLREAPHLSGRQDVVLPAYTCPSLVTVVLEAGLNPRLVDISPHSLDFDRSMLEGLVGDRTLVVICVHPFGLPQPIGDVLELAKAAGAGVVEDAARAMGARMEGRMVGTKGDLGLFSLGPGKPLSTAGGGILCVRDDEQARLVEQAWADLPYKSTPAAAWALIRLSLVALAFHPLGWWLATRVGLHRMGDNEAMQGFSLSGLTEAQAGVGLALLERLDAANRCRRENARQLVARLSQLDFVHIPQPAAESEPIYLRLPIIVDDEGQRERSYRKLWAAGIGVGRMYRKPLSELFPRIAAATCPGADYVARHLLTLPTHRYLTAEDVESIAHISKSVVGGNEQ